MQSMSLNAAAIFLGAAAGEPAAAWLREALTDIEKERPTITFFERSWAAAGRRLGTARLAASIEETQTLPFSPAGFCADEYGRTLLLRAVLAGQPPGTHTGLVDDIYTTGELREQQAVLRALPHLPDPQRFTTIAVEAVRTNALTVIESIACENPYPARFFPDPAFNQLVLKCLFCTVSLRRLDGLPQRISPELKRMVASYVSERRAGGRPVPEDTSLILEGDTHAPV
jgi:hypothetical protein